MARCEVLSFTKYFNPQFYHVFCSNNAYIPTITSVFLLSAHCIADPRSGLCVADIRVSPGFVFFVDCYTYEAHRHLNL